MRNLVIVASLVALLLTGCDSSKEVRFREACTEQGGFVAKTSSTWFTERIDCIKGNQVLYLPGFA